MENSKSLNQDVEILEIADWSFNPGRCELQRGETLLKLEPLLCDFLLYLAQRPGELASREELLEHVWRGRVVSDDSLRRAVKKLRLALGDDAKNPIYIKTKPLQGYVLVAPVRAIRPRLNKTLLNHRPMLAVMLLLFLAVLMTLGVGLFKQKPTDSIELSSSPNTERLTSLSGAEADGSFHEASQRLLFSYRAQDDERSQLYVKDLGNALLTKISHGDGDFYHGLFSPDGQKIAYNHKAEEAGPSAIYIADFDPDRGLVTPKRASLGDHARRLISWSADGAAVYFLHEASYSEPWEIFRYHIETEEIEQITYSAKQGYGAFYAKESPDGHYLAILKNVVGRRYAMTIMDLQNNSLVVERNLSFFGNKVLWLSKSSAIDSDDGSRAGLIIGSFKGELSYYSIASDRIWPQGGTLPGLNDAFYDCGPSCFYMRQHGMNYTDVKEIANPFVVTSNKAMLLLESEKAEFHPMYSRDGTSIFYTQKDEKTAAIVQHNLRGNADVLLEFNPREVVREMVQSPDQRWLLGRLEDRLFILDLTSLDFKYISSELEKVGPPSWSRDSKKVFYARINGDNSDLYSYDIASEETRYLEAGLSYLRQLKDGRDFLIDHELKLYQRDEHGERQFIHNFTYLSGSTWQVQGDYVYFSEPVYGHSYLVQYDLKTKQKRKQLLSKSTDYWEFHLHPDGDRLLKTRFQTADSDLLKVQWPSSSNRP
ncbi:winged helix-turn-helix domain-containing protein [uncultured Pseudoteredinibacter sp.]|uniref:winged helix-turn-helix domain-containing protein n=1 Tax=uncultured Pseudoteredinibacter sp. TaxID=1641701 RepID=UPI002606BCE9|nr:winged helix-turn-helix domain-containing protein [uncultured Pseudoteredinibacter sp.]